MTKKACYYNIYYDYNRASFDSKPFRSEAWYLVLSPTMDKNYYKSNRYMDSFTVGKYNNKEKYTIIKDITTIEKLIEMGPSNKPKQ